MYDSICSDQQYIHPLVSDHMNDATCILESVAPAGSLAAAGHE